MKTVAVKYCGGCNPRLDRVTFVNRLFSEFEALVPGVAETEPWLALVVNGCRRACAEHRHIQGRKVIVCDDADYESLHAYISDLL